MSSPGARFGGQREYTADEIARLTALWAAGVSVAEIGRNMGLSKNAVVGKVHRLKLPMRQSPIKRGGAPKPARLRGALARATGSLADGRGSAAAALKGATLAALGAAQTSAPHVVTVAAQHGWSVARACCWPMWSDHVPPPRPALYCGAEADDGRPYCAAHAAVAYRRLEVAA